MNMIFEIKTRFGRTPALGSLHSPQPHIGTMNRRQTGTISWPRRGNDVSLSPRERVAVRAGFLHTNFAYMGAPVSDPASWQEVAPNGPGRRPELRLMGRVRLRRPVRCFGFILIIFTALAGFILATPVGAADASTNELTLETARPLAEKGDAKAQFYMGKFYTKGNGVPKDYAKAVEYFRLSAAQGYAKAQNNLGAFYARGWGVTPDFTEAAKWFRRAAEQGDPFSQYSLGMYYALGLGVATNLTEAVKWYEKAGEQQQPDAQLALGNLYLLGDKDQGIMVDIKKARKWLEKAAAQGCASACNSLGFIYESGGDGVDKDQKQAAKWYRQAAENNDSKGQMNLGRMYLHGIGVKKDLIEAYKWFYLASRNGAGVARHYMRESQGDILGDFGEQPLTSDQINEAIQRAKEAEKTVIKKPSK